MLNFLRIIPSGFTAVFLGFLICPAFAWGQPCGVPLWGSPLIVVPAPVISSVPCPVPRLPLVVPTLPVPPRIEVHPHRSGNTSQAPKTQDGVPTPSLSVPTEPVLPAKSTATTPGVIPPSSPSLPSPGNAPPPRIAPVDPSGSPRPVNPLVIPLGPTEQPGPVPKPPTPVGGTATPIVPPATPTPADAPVEPKGLVVPSIVPKPANREPNLPPLTLPTTPSGSTSFARPLPERNGITWDLFPVAARSTEVPGIKIVRFLNTSQQSVRVSVNGSSVDLPAGHSVQTRADRTIRWAINQKGETETVIPEAAEGVEVVIRDAKISD